MTFAEMQLGKNGMTSNFLETLKTYFQKHDSVRISVLQSAREDKEQIRKYCEEILNHLGSNYTTKTIGFKIIVKKWRKGKIKN
jgi:RNA-binding protein YhbY